MGKSVKPTGTVMKTTPVKKTANNSEQNKEELNEQEQVISLNIVQEMMKIQQDTMLACFNQVVENLSRKVDSIMCDVQDLKTGLNFMSAEHVEKFKEISTDIKLVKTEVFNTKMLSVDERNVMKQHSVKLINLEDRSRRNNLRIDGLVENEGENWEMTELKVKDLFREQLQISEEIEIDRAHRVGTKQGGRHRTIVLRCNKYKQKEEIKKAAKKLKGSGIYINDDFSTETLEIRKQLLQSAKELRRQGKGAKVVHDRLVTWEREERVDQYRNSDEH